MKRSIIGRAQWLKALYICRAIFHDAVSKGRSLSFFRNCKMNIEQNTSLYPFKKQVI